MRDNVQKSWEAAVSVAYAARRRASESLDDVPHRLRLSSYPTGRIGDLYGSLSVLLGIMGRIWRLGAAIRPDTGATCNDEGAYALIAAISGAMPMMFMTRLRL